MELTSCLVFVNPGEHLLNLVDLAHCTSLVDLTLRLHVVRTIHSITTVGMPWEPFRAFLPRLSPTIQNVTVDIRSGPLLGAQRFLHDTEIERWSGIEDRVDRLVNLKTLNFDFHHVPDAKPSLHMTPETFATQLEHILVHKLPRLKALRKLSFSNVVILDSVSPCPFPSASSLDTIPSHSDRPIYLHAEFFAVIYLIVLQDPSSLLCIPLYQFGCKLVFTLTTTIREHNYTLFMSATTQITSEPCSATSEYNKSQVQYHERNLGKKVQVREMSQEVQIQRKGYNREKVVDNRNE